MIYNMPYDPISSLQSLTDVLASGALFCFEVGPSASRAFLHSVAGTHDPALKAILNTKLNYRDGSKMSIQLRKFRATLNAVNQKLKPHLYLGDIPTCDTLLEQLIQEEQLVQAYVKQAIHNGRNEQVRELSKGHFHLALKECPQEPDMRHLIQFFTCFPQYATPEQKAHLDVLRTRNEEKIEQFEMKDAPPKPTLLKLFPIAPGVRGNVVIFILLSIMYSLIMEIATGVRGATTMLIMLGAIVWPGFYAVATLSDKWHATANAARLSAERHLNPLVLLFTDSVGHWDNVLAPKTFEQKWMLRAYFALMHSDSLDDVKDFRHQRLMNFHRLDIEQFAYLVYRTSEQANHTHSMMCNPYFSHAN